ncbi:MAG: hypothetical protein L3J52_08520 [Proteobacteria bacterium]|nr:hypothetical protein [Pseudomonadota bacterium]
MKVIIFALSLILITSCGGVPRSKKQNLPPTIDIALLDFNQGLIILRVKHRHIKASSENKLSCKISFTDIDEHQFDNQPVPDLTSFATETVSINIESLQKTKHSTTNGSIDYVLACSLSSEEFSTVHLVNRSTLYLVPGENSIYR